MPKRVVAVTGSRAEYSLLRPLLAALRADPFFDLQIIATASHLAPAFGCTVQQIEADGFVVNERVETLLASDSPVGIAKSMGLGVMGVAEAYARLRPDIALLIGDRYEMLAAAQAAVVAQIPIAHVAGGDVTANAFDDPIRHSISKMAHLHFVTNEPAAVRLQQMGEDPACIFNVGSPAIDELVRRPRLRRNELEPRLNFRFRERNLLVTFHPVTLLSDHGLAECREVLRALSTLGDEFGMIFTKPNADTKSYQILQELEQFVAGRGNAVLYDSLGPELYWNVMEQVDVVVGNSSSGLYEAPTLKKPAVNVGSRQSGRILAASVIQAEASATAIASAIRTALTLNCSEVVNPYGDGHATEKIVPVLRRALETGIPIVKRFYELRRGGKA
jgi:UDP-N-acetylglucosamine 2-epimerase (non-hydrolysing)/GDP/UDP-N,N'-diacetylbacillosamine 2-epimerase (hydrolysing)